MDNLQLKIDNYYSGWGELEGIKYRPFHNSLPKSSVQCTGFGQGIIKWAFCRANNGIHRILQLFLDFPKFSNNRKEGYVLLSVF